MRPIAVVLASAACAAALTLSFAWPRVTNADPSDGAGPGTRFGKVAVETKIEREPETNKWFVRLHAQNRGDEGTSLTLRAGLTRTVSDPRDRAEPHPQTLWREDTKLELAPGAASDESFEIPEKVAERMTKDANRPAGPYYQAPMGGGGYITINYGVMLLPVKTRS
jgi:hypothetical protein